MHRETETNAQRGRDKCTERQRELETERLTLDVEVSEAADRLGLWDDRGAALALGASIEH